jgi:hypothetical protein
MIIGPDHFPDLSYLGQECFADVRDGEYERARKDGVWGIESQYNLGDGRGWVSADSVWGFIGDDYKGSGYDDDIRSAAISALRERIRMRCRLCKGSGFRCEG